MRWWLAVSIVAAGQSFESELQPVFRKHCYGCHAANVKMGSLDVETLDGLTRGGNQGPIVVPGNAAESRLYQTLTWALEPRMPMGGKQLSQDELNVVRRWIDNGARPDVAGVAWQGETIAAGYGGDIRLFAPNGKLTRKIPAQVGTIRAVALSPDGRFVAAKGNEFTHTFEVATGKEAAELEGGFQKGTTALSPDGRKRARIRHDGSVAFEDVQ
jgi:hypothetical protein